MDEGTKILISAGAGFVAGLLGETFKFPLTQRLKRRQVRSAIYKDLALILISLKASEQRYDHHHRLENSRLDVFDYFYNTERIAFYQIQECYALTNIYDLIRSYTNEESPEEAQRLLGAIMSCYRINANRTLDNKLLDREENKFVRYMNRRASRGSQKGSNLR